MSKIKKFTSYKGATETNYEYKGTKNQTDFPQFIRLCKESQKSLKNLLPAELEAAGYENVYIGDGYIYAKGDIPILLTAHLDTVHAEPVHDFYELVEGKGKDKTHKISSPQGIGGDDRCGIYAILQVIKTLRPSVLFCEDEETGCQGSRKFVKTKLVDDLKELNYLIELDRKGNNDAVFYSCDNPDFTKFIEESTGYKEAWGSCSDISILSPACGIASVNFSTGYYNPHLKTEYVIMEDLMRTIGTVIGLLQAEAEAEENVQYAYIEEEDDWYDYGYGGYGKYGYGYGNYDYGYTYGKKTVEPLDEYTILLRVEFENSKGEAEEAYVEGTSLEDAWWAFFFEYKNVCYAQVLDYDYDEY